MTNDTHDATVVVEDRFVVNFFGSGALRAYVCVACSASSHGVAYAWDLGLFIEIENHVENRMFDWEFDWFSVWEDATDFVVKIIILAVAPKIVDHEESTVEEVVA